MSDQKAGRVLGVGGVFFRSAKPKELGAWYADHLGIDIESWGTTYGTSFTPAAMPAQAFTVWSVFAADTEYFGDSGQSHMINLVVDDLNAALQNVAAGGAQVLPELEEHDFGRLWLVCRSGWQPGRIVAATRGSTGH